MKQTDLQILREAAGRYRKVQIERAIPSESLANGFVLDLSDKLLLLSQFHDFQPEGCSILRLEDIVSVRSDEHERLWERILAAEGLLDAVGLRDVPPLDDMGTLLRHLAATGTPAIVEDEVPLYDDEDPEEDDEDEGEFLIGYVDRVEDDVCWVWNFDPLGRWDEEPQPLEVDLVTRVQIEAPYLETFLRHIPPCPGRQAGRN